MNPPLSVHRSSAAPNDSSISSRHTILAAEEAEAITGTPMSSSTSIAARASSDPLAPVIPTTTGCPPFTPFEAYMLLSLYSPYPETSSDATTETSTVAET